MGLGFRVKVCGGLGFCATGGTTCLGRLPESSLQFFLFVIDKPKQITFI